MTKTGVYVGAFPMSATAAIVAQDGRYSEDIDPQYWAQNRKVIYLEDENYPETDYVVVNKAKFLLTAESQNTGMGVVRLDPVAQDGKYYEGTMVSAIATPVSANYKFVAWTYKGNVVSTDATYTFPMPSMKYQLVATFVEDSQSGSGSSASANIEISGGTFTIDNLGINGITQTYVHTTGSVGTKYTVVYNGSEESFLYWKNNSDKIVTKSMTYSFTLATDMVLVAVTTTGASATQVSFVTNYDQILSTHTYTQGKTVAIPASVPTYVGATFAGWQLTVDGTVDAVYAHGEVQAAIEAKLGTARSVIAKATFTRPEGTVDLTITFVDTNGNKINRVDDIVTPVRVGQFNCQLEDVVVPSGMYVQAWKLGNTVISKTDRAYIRIMNATDDVTLKVVLGESRVDAEPVAAALNSTKYVNASGKPELAFTFSYVLAEGYEIVERGYFLHPDSSEGLDIGTYNEKGAIKGTDQVVDEGTYTLTIPLNLEASQSRTFYVRAYMACRINGETVYFYSDIVSLRYAD